MACNPKGCFCCLREERDPEPVELTIKEYLELMDEIPEVELTDSEPGETFKVKPLEVNAYVPFQHH